MRFLYGRTLAFVGLLAATTMLFPEYIISTGIEDYLSGVFKDGRASKIFTPETGWICFAGFIVALLPDRTTRLLGNLIILIGLLLTAFYLFASSFS